MNLQERTRNRTEISKLIQELYFKVKNIFKDLTNGEAKQLANAISNITGGFIRIYGYNNENGTPPNVPLLVNDSETIVLRNTNNTEVKFYPNSEYPLTIKTKEDINLNLPNGKYFRIYTQVDNLYGVDRLFKNITKDTLIGNFEKNAYLQVGIENFGSDLTQAQPYNITIQNNTSVLPKIRMESQYASLRNEVATDGKVIVVNPFQNWDYTYTYWGAVDMTNQSQGIKLQIFTNDGNNNLLSTGYAYAGSNYSNTNNWMGQIYNGYGTRNFKIVISYI